MKSVAFELEQTWVKEGVYSEERDKMAPILVENRVGQREKLCKRAIFCRKCGLGGMFLRRCPSGLRSSTRNAVVKAAQVRILLSAHFSLLEFCFSLGRTSVSNKGIPLRLDHILLSYSFLPSNLSL